MITGDIEEWRCIDKQAETGSRGFLNSSICVSQFVGSNITIAAHIPPQPPLISTAMTISFHLEESQKRQPFFAGINSLEDHWNTSCATSQRGDDSNNNQNVPLGNERALGSRRRYFRLLVHTLARNPEKGSATLGAVGGCSGASVNTAANSCQQERDGQMRD